MMKTSDIREKSEGRRDFLKNGLRTIVLSLILFVSGLLSWRAYRSAGTELACQIKLPCRACSKYTDCEYAQAG